MLLSARSNAITRLPFQLCRLVLVLAAITIAAAGEALAHGFKVGLVAPLSGPEAARGRDLRDGFLLAARERDGHADQESDGHLGRMDVYLLAVDGARGAELVLKDVEALIGREPVTFLLVATNPRLTAAIGEMAGSAIVVDLDGVGGFGEAGGKGLATSFERDYGRPLTPAAGLGHAVAWRIDRTIRAVGEDVSDRKALRAAFDEAGF